MLQEKLVWCDRTQGSHNVSVLFAVYFPRAVILRSKCNFDLSIVFLCDTGIGLSLYCPKQILQVMHLQTTTAIAVSSEVLLIAEQSVCENGSKQNTVQQLWSQIHLATITLRQTHTFRDSKYCRQQDNKQVVLLYFQYKAKRTWLPKKSLTCWAWHSNALSPDAASPDAALFIGFRNHYKKRKKMWRKKRKNKLF